jgi:molybdenum cofactor cytidylyltransferase
MGMIVGVILAAGESKRMGQPKALLKIGEHTFLDHIALSLAASQINLVYAVLGNQAEIIQSSLKKNIPIVHNPNYQEGQLSSLKAAIERIQFENCDGVLVALVDHPLISSGIVRRMVEAFYSSKKKIIIPTLHGKRGHPVLYSRELFEEILAIPPGVGANAVRQAYRDHTLELEVDDPGVLIDIDTPEDYERHIIPLQAKVAVLAHAAPDLLK